MIILVLFWLQSSFVIYHLNNMVSSLDKYQNIFFIGVAGAGMSALAQFLAGIKKPLVVLIASSFPGSTTKQEINWNQKESNVSYRMEVEWMIIPIL